MRTIIFIWWTVVDVLTVVAKICRKICLKK